MGAFLERGERGGEFGVGGLPEKGSGRSSGGERLIGTRNVRGIPLYSSGERTLVG